MTVNTMLDDETPESLHRRYTVRAINGISYVNDSEANDVTLAAQTLEDFQNVYWIIGGQASEAGLNGLETYMDRIRHAFLIGSSETDVSAWLNKQGVENTPCGNIENAVRLAHSMAQSQRGLPGAGNTVLFCPACKSKDQFESYEHRGEVFVRLVQELPEEETA